MRRKGTARVECVQAVAPVSDTSLAAVLCRALQYSRTRVEMAKKMNGHSRSAFYSTCLEFVCCALQLSFEGDFVRNRTAPACCRIELKFSALTLDTLNVELSKLQRNISNPS